MAAKKAARAAPRSSKGPAKRAARKSAPANARSDATSSAGEDWRPVQLERLRRLIREADPDVVEEVKWRKPSNPAGVPVWSHDGILCTGETYKRHLRLTFFHGSALADPKKLFNANLVGARRAIQVEEGDVVDAAAFKALIREAVAFNTSK